MAKTFTHYQNTLRGLAVKPDSYRSAHPVISDHFTHDVAVKAKAYAGAAEDLAKKELAEVSEHVRHDLDEFSHDYHKSLEDFKLSAWYQAWDKITWGTLSSITDKTQVEWTEVGDDLEHAGHYHVGDEVGFGVLICVRCGYKKELFHPSKILSCANCDGEEFMREAFEP